MEEKFKTVFLQVRIEPELKDSFRDVCKKKAINPSELVRQWIDAYVKEQLK